MDSITHLALGACTGELILGKKLGKRAMLWGAISANIPDVDIIPGYFMRGDKALLFHRGITHSFFFALVFGVVLALIAKRNRPKITLSVFIFFFCFQLALHDLLDTCTSYGTGLFEPFNHARVSFHLLYVADPLFTISLLVAAVYLLWGSTSRVKWAAVAVIVSTLYVGIAIWCKVYTDNRVNATLTTPAPFTTLMWFCVRKTDSGYYTAYSSVFDKAAPAVYGYHPRNDSLLKQPEPYLRAFANGYYTVSLANGHKYFNVLRFGQIHGWLNNNALFTLSYPLDAQGNENMVVQKGRFAGWNKHTFKLYIERIAGK